MKWMLILIVGGLAAPGFAQQVPFFTPGATAFDPQVSVLTSGVLNDVQATVSHDRKYVTINAQPSLSSLVALQKFQFQTGGGIVGVGTVVGANQVGAGAAASPTQGITPASGLGGQSILLREGMTRLTPLAQRSPASK